MTPQGETKRTDWYVASFEADYYRVYRHRSPEEARAVLAHVLDFLNLPAGIRCLDLCCGYGRHLTYLVERGYDAYGIDLSAYLLEKSTDLPATCGRLARADMGCLPFSGTFDFVFSFFTSFGYFRDDAENAGAIAELSRVLKPGGGFFIDFLNPEFVRNTLVPEDQREFPGFTLIQRRRINQQNDSVDKELIVIDDRGERRYLESVKLYGRDDFDTFCRAVDLKLTACYGDRCGDALTAESSRMFLIGEKHGR